MEKITLSNQIDAMQQAETKLYLLDDTRAAWARQGGSTLAVYDVEVGRAARAYHACRQAVELTLRSQGLTRYAHRGQLLEATIHPDRVEIHFRSLTPSNLIPAWVATEQMETAWGTFQVPGLDCIEMSLTPDEVQLAERQHQQLMADAVVVS
jgi:hypothetical protein